VLYCLISHPCVLCVLLLQLASKARSVIRTLDPQNDITFLRVRSKKHEIMVAPDKDYLLFVIQNPNSEEESSA
jgi:dynein light chain roadblock-type